MSGPPPVARLDLLIESLAHGLLRLYGVTRPPVPIFEMLEHPPAGMERDLDLCLGLPFGEAIYLRLLNGQGTVFVNPALPNDRQRYASAGALLIGLLHSPGGRALSPGLTPDHYPEEATDYFARCLLLPAQLLPPGFATMTVSELAELFGVPPEVVSVRLAELNGN